MEDILCPNCNTENHELRAECTECAYRFDNNNPEPIKISLFTEPNPQKYTLSKKWEQLFVGGNGRICWGVWASNPWHDKVKDKGRSSKWPLNDYVMKGQENQLDYFCWRFDITEDEYHKLMAKLETLPKYAS